jgi:hypothetical protein
MQVRLSPVIKLTATLEAFLKRTKAVPEGQMLVQLLGKTLCHITHKTLKPISISLSFIPNILSISNKMGFILIFYDI